MSGISSSVGLISGMDIAGIVTQLMQLEARPLTLLQQRVENTNQQKLAYQTISAQVMAAVSSISRLSEASAFSARTATSSNPEALAVTADAGAPLGGYSFLVRSIVSTHQMASLGFADRNATPVGAGTLTFETAQARVDPDTELALLNGGDGVRRGQIRIIDRSGASANIDLRSAYTVGDVLDAINSQSQVSVRAFVQDDRLVIEDTTGLPDGQNPLTVSNVGTSLTATDLGLAGAEAGTGRIVSAHDLVRLTTDTSLASLNDRLGLQFDPSRPDLRISLANGLRTFDINLTSRFDMDISLAELNGGQGVGEGTIRITNKAGDSEELHLTGTETLNDIRTMLADEYGHLGVTIVSASSSGNIILSDNSEGTGTFKIEDVSGSIASQLKLAGETAAGEEETTLTGRANYQFSTLQSLITKVQYARDTEGNLNNGDLEIAISADGKGIVVIDNTSGGQTTIEALNDSKALEGLGLTGTFVDGRLDSDRLISGINTVLLRNLNGGAGVALDVGEFQLRDGGNTLTVDFSGAQTLQDIINRINAQGSLRAEVDGGGTSLVISDLSTGTGVFSASGATLSDLGLAGTSTTGRLAGGDLNRKYISEGTSLSSLNGGKGIGLKADESGSTVKFQITNTAGETAVVTLSGSSHHTVGDVLRAINDAMSDKGVQARINAGGDGIELYEESPAGSGRLKVTEVGNGTAAAALGIKGEATEEEPGALTGSFAGQIEVGPADTLDDVLAKINSAGLNVRASIINDGSGSRPYRLVISSTASGTAGQMAFSTGGSGLAFETLTEAQDARVVMGNLDSPTSILVSSSSNKITGLAQGLTLNLTAASDTPIHVSVSQNVDSLVENLNGFITAYNGTLDQIAELTKFDPDTNEKGILLGDSAVRQLQDRLYREASRSLPGEYSVRRLTSVGISFGSGGRITLDETAFRNAFDADPEGVKKLFTHVAVTTDEDGEEKAQRVGIAARLKEELRNITSATNGLLGQQTGRLDERLELYARQIANQEKLLEQKEKRYYLQFQAMEKALAEMQSQQSALGALANLANSFGVQNVSVQ